MSGSGISWAICKSAPRSRQITTPAPHHSVFYRPDALPAAQPTASKQWRQKIKWPTVLNTANVKTQLTCVNAYRCTVGRVHIHHSPHDRFICKRQGSRTPSTSDVSTQLQPGIVKDLQQQRPQHSCNTSSNIQNNNLRAVCVTGPITIQYDTSRLDLPHGNDN